MDDLWQHAWQWLCRRRQKSPPGADIWQLRFHRERELPRLIREAESGTYRLSPMQVIRRKPGQESLVQWSARDALVLKWVSLQLNGKLPLSPRCTHTAGHRGGRDGLQEITAHLREGHCFMYRTDIRGYYRHISKAQLKRHTERFIPEPHLRQLVYQYIDYSAGHGGGARPEAKWMLRALHQWMVMITDRFLTMQFLTNAKKTKWGESILCVCASRRLITAMALIGALVPECYGSTTEVVAVERSKHRFELSHTVTIKRLDNAPIIMDHDRIAISRIALRDGARGANVTFISATPWQGGWSNSITCDVTRINNIQWEVRQRMKIKPEQSGSVTALSGNCTVVFEVKDAPAGLPTVETMGESILNDNGNTFVAMGFRDVAVSRRGAGYHDDISAVYVPAGVQPTAWSTKGVVTIGDKQITQPAANLKVVSTDQVILSPNTPQAQALTVSGTGYAMSRWRSNAGDSKIHFTDQQGKVWEAGVARRVSSGDKYDVKLKTPQSLKWGKWQEEVIIEWDIL